MTVPGIIETSDEERRYRAGMEMQIRRKMNTIAGGWRRCGHEACRRAKFCCGTPLQCVLKPRKLPTPEQHFNSMAKFRKQLEQRMAEVREQDPDYYDYYNVKPWQRPNGGLMTLEEFAEWAREVRVLQRSGRAPQR